MPIPLIIGALAIALVSVGITFFNWRVYVRPQVNAGGLSVEGGIGGGGGAGGGVPGSSGSFPWVPIALVAAGAIVLVKVL